MEKIVLQEFDATEIISYQDYLKMINELQTWYQGKMGNIKNSYAELLEKKEFHKAFKIMKAHNEVIVELIKRIIGHFNLENIDIAIYLSNSFARETNLIDSDIDLNFMYEDEDKGKIIEELVSDSLSRILNKYRDFVHDSISHRIPKSDIHVSENEKVVYEISFSDGKINSVITSGNENLMYKLYNSHKSFNSFIKYYTGYLNDESISEWIYFQKKIYSTPNYLDVLFSYIEVSEKELGNNNLDSQKNNLIETIKNKLTNLETMNFSDMAEFKRFFKNDVYRIIYEVLILLKKDKKDMQFCPVSELINLFNSLELKELVSTYFGSVMLFNYICDLYGIEFRTRHSNIFPEDFYEFFKDKMDIEVDFVVYFKNLVNKIFSLLIEELLKIIVDVSEYNKYDPLTEQINVENYSPLSYINNISKEYQHKPFLLPFINHNGQIIPIHPDTLDDLNISRKDVCKYELVYPTSSFRTVYLPKYNVFYKIPVLRQITRSIRDMKNKELKRSEIASKELAKYSCPNFSYLEEECIYGDEEIYNYIVRKLPERKVYPWFYCIASQNNSLEFQLKCIDNMIKLWMFYASKGIYFESAHTQNFLVDDDANIYYRDLSDIRILKYDIMTPSYIDEVENEGELLSVFFDRSMCSQNIEHFIRYCKDVSQKDINHIKQTIATEIKKYDLAFPNYSMNYDKNREGHHPIKTELVRLRNLDID